jgi:two-component system cell cycle response regulator
MKDNKRFSVLPIGFSAYERKLFESIVSLTKGRTRSYRIADDSQARVDIFVVNGDEPDAVRIWQDRRSASGGESSLVVSKSPIPQAGAAHVRRPLIFTRLVAALDQLTTQKLKFAPELVIEQGADVSSELERTLKQLPDAVGEGSQFRALVVDDSPSVRKLMEIELRISGITGDFAESAGKAWELLSSRSYDIIFLDVVLPDVDGYQICKSIKKDPSKKHTPVIMLTGKSSPFDRVRGKLAGCNSYLVKPVPHDALQNVFRGYLPARDKRADHLPLGDARPTLAHG